MKVRDNVLAAFCVLALAACDGPGTPFLEDYDPAGGYRYAALADAPAAADNAEDLFVILTISGGGMRSAALGYGVMERLRDTRIVWNGQERSLLDEVDVVSGVSGGAFPAAYYAAFGERIFEDFEDRFLYRNVNRALGLELLWPAWIPAPDYARSDVAARYYDRSLFDGLTYGDLMKRGRRPYLVLHGTDMATTAPFAFTQTRFDHICGDLAGLTLGRAVAASSAFPFLLSPVTLENRAGACGGPGQVMLATAAGGMPAPGPVREPGKLAQAYEDPRARPFIHLLDGGITDYLGLRTVLQELDSDPLGWRLSAALGRGEISRLVVVTVDGWAERSPVDGATREPPGVVAAIETLAYRAADQSRDSDGLLRRWLRRAGWPAEPPFTHAIRIGFDDLADPALRDRFNRIESQFTLPAAEIDDLRAAGSALLAQSQAFRDLVQDLN